MQDADLQLSAANHISVIYPDIDVRRIGGAVHDHFSVDAVAQELARGHVVGVRVSIDRVKEAGRKGFREPQVFFDLILLGVDRDADFLLGATQDIGETAARSDLLEKGILLAHGDCKYNLNR